MLCPPTPARAQAASRVRKRAKMTAGTARTGSLSPTHACVHAARVPSHVERTLSLEHVATRLP